jgi:predicted RNase H-like nuclease (RuvC/YqgF family)
MTEYATMRMVMHLDSAVNSMIESVEIINERQVADHERIRDNERAWSIEYNKTRELKEDITQLAALQMEFKKELDMLKEGHMDLARRIDHNEMAVLQTAKIRELMEENRGLRARVEYLDRYTQK